MPKQMIANFSDEAYAALQNGEAVDNNGFRSKKGNFYPEQPSFSPINKRQEQFKDIGVQLVRDITSKIILPFTERFVNEKIYPFAVGKWEEWLLKHQSKKTTPKPMPVQSVDDNTPCEDICSSHVINLANYRKMA